MNGCPVSSLFSDRKAGEVLFNDKGGCAFVFLFRGKVGKHDVEVRDSAVCDKDLRPVQNIFIAFFSAVVFMPPASEPEPGSVNP